MTKKVAVLLSEGFEEAEAVIVIDVLRRMEIDVELLSCQDRLELRSYHQIRMFADALLERRMDKLYDAVVIPGGPQATSALATNTLAVEFIRRHDRAAKLICPMCSAAARVLWLPISCCKAVITSVLAICIRVSKTVSTWPKRLWKMAT